MGQGVPGAMVQGLWLGLGAKLTVRVSGRAMVGTPLSTHKELHEAHSRRAGRVECSFHGDIRDEVRGRGRGRVRTRVKVRCCLSAERERGITCSSQTSALFILWPINASL